MFDNFFPSTLVSVVVYADSDGFRTIELRTVVMQFLQDTTLFIPYSPNGVRIYLNFNLPVQNNMQLGLDGLNNDLFRNSNGALFPYNINDIVTITGTNAPIEYYYFFYDWEVKKRIMSLSNVSTVIATIEDNTSNNSNIVACNAYLWPVNGQTYSASGTFINISTNPVGCIHTDTLNLTINYALSDTIDTFICLGDTVYIGNNIYYNSGVYTTIH